MNEYINGKFTFKTTKNWLGRVIYISNDKQYGQGFRESEIRKYGLNQYEIQYTDGYKYIGSGDCVESVEEAKHLALYFIKGD